MVFAKAVAPLLGKKGYGETHLVGRALSGFFDLLTVWLVYRITRRFTHRRAALFAAGLSAFCVLGIQLSHFWAVDAVLTAFTAAALYGAVRIAQDRSGIAGDALTGVAIGLAAACKITALALFAPVGIALLVRAFTRGRGRGAIGVVGSLFAAVPRGLALLAAAAVTVRVLLPHVFLGPSPLSFRLDPRWLDDLRRLKILSSSVAGFPPALQWAGRTLLYPVENFVLWGAGVAFGLAAIVALVWSIAAILRRDAARARAADAVRPLPLPVPRPDAASSRSATSTRRTPRWRPSPAWRSRRGWRARASRGSRVLCALGVLGVTFLWAVAFTSIYRRPHTRVEATRWIYAHVPPPKAFANESWDDGLPMPMPDNDPARYAGPSMPLFDPDSPEKVETCWSRRSTEADWVAVTSGRVYMNVTRVPEVFPMSIAYYRALFDGRLGFERAADFTSYPSLGPLRFPDDRAEEQFTVYDHPRVLLFRKTPAFSPAQRAEPPARGHSRDAADDARLGALAAGAPPRDRRRSVPTARVVEGADRRPTPSPGPRARWAPRSAGTSPSPSSGCSPCRSRSPPSRVWPTGASASRGILGLVLVTYFLTFGLTLRLVANGRRAAFACLAVLAAASAVVLPAPPARSPALPAREPPRAPPERSGVRRGLPPVPRAFARSTPRSSGARSRWTSRSSTSSSAPGRCRPPTPGSRERRSATTRSARRWWSS